jgi:transposase InsO family protein
MSYTQNPYQPKLRRDVAAYAYKQGVRPASRHFGIPPGTVTKWMQKAKVYGEHPIPTRSSRPRSHPKQLSNDIVRKIIELRLKTKRTSEVVHQELLNQGIRVSLNSVRRTIDRHGLMKKRSHLKRWHPPVERPEPQKPGDLVQMDTIHRMIDEKKRLYIFVILDVYSRWVYAKAFAKMNAATSIRFVREAELRSAFPFEMLQSDHGPEFGMWFVEQAKRNHRYTRIGKPNDNAHIERFNRTVQEECLDKIPTDVKAINCALRKYLHYYNNHRLHLGINLKTPVQLLSKCFQGIG